MRNVTPHIGVDGFLTLGISLVVAVMTLGISYALVLWRVVSKARNAPTDPGRVNRVVVLGKGPAGEHPDLEYRQRLDRAAQLHRVHGAQLLLLGGITGGGKLSEAEVGMRYLKDSGVDPAVIELENRSQHSLQNLREARHILGDMHPGDYALLSSRYHLARISTLAQGLGMGAQVVAAEDRLAPSLITNLKLLLEAGYLHWYFCGKYWSLWTGNRKSLNRIS